MPNQAANFDMTSNVGRAMQTGNETTAPGFRHHSASESGGHGPLGKPQIACEGR